MYDHTLAIYRIVVMKTRRRFFLLLKEFRKSTLRIYHIPLLNLFFSLSIGNKKKKKITLIIHKHQSFHPLKNTRKESPTPPFSPTLPSTLLPFFASLYFPFFYSIVSISTSLPHHFLCFFSLISTLKVFCPQPPRGSKPKYFPMQRDITHRTRANSIVNVNLITCRHIQFFLNPQDTQRNQCNSLYSLLLQ